MSVKAGVGLTLTEDWWEECRIPERTVKRHLLALAEKKLILTAVWKFAGNPTTHISLNFEMLEKLILEKPLGQTGLIEASQNSPLEKAKSARTNKEAETTAETTAQITTSTNNHGYVHVASLRDRNYAGLEQTPDWAKE